MKKRLLSLLMAAFMVTSLAACGSTGSDVYKRQAWQFCSMWASWSLASATCAI